MHFSRASSQIIRSRIQPLCCELHQGSARLEDDFCNVRACSNVEVTGVQGLEYLESLVTPRQKEKEERNAVDFKGEVRSLRLVVTRFACVATSRI